MLEEIRKKRLQRYQIDAKIIDKQEANKTGFIEIFFQSVAATVKIFPAKLTVETKLTVTKVIVGPEFQAINQLNSRNNIVFLDHSNTPSS